MRPRREGEIADQFGGEYVQELQSRHDPTPHRSTPSPRPHIVCEESVHHVWHTFECLGNIIIFFLAGALTGKVMVHIEWDDYMRLGVIYMLLVVFSMTQSGG